MRLKRSSPHQLNADLCTTDLMETRGHSFDAITDHDLHREGLSLLSLYRVVVTGSHPEYWTREMLDALAAYLAAGGRLGYPGPTGFFWVTSVDPTRPHVIELRRGQAASRSWESPPGESRHSTTG